MKSYFIILSISCMMFSCIFLSNPRAKKSYTQMPEVTTDCAQMIFLVRSERVVPWPWFHLILMCVFCTSNVWSKMSTNFGWAVTSPELWQKTPRDLANWPGFGGHDCQANPCRWTRVQGVESGVVFLWFFLCVQWWLLLLLLAKSMVILNNLRNVSFFDSIHGDCAYDSWFIMIPFRKLLPELDTSMWMGPRLQ